MPVSDVFVAIDTTGLPSRDPTWAPKVVAFAFAFVGPDGAIRSKGTLVRQPIEHLRDPRTFGAFKANGLDPNRIAVEGVPEEDVATAFRARFPVEGTVHRGFNVAFLRAFLAPPPWGLVAWGSCLMEEATTKIGSGTLRNSNRLRYVSLDTATAWASDRGFDVSPPPDITLRAEINAVRVAKLYRALRSA